MNVIGLLEACVITSVSLKILSIIYYAPRKYFIMPIVIPAYEQSLLLSS